jgi:hypothetical protein
VEPAAELAKYEILHVQTLKKLIQQENIDCEFTLTRTCNVFRSQETADQAKDIYDILMQAGLDYMDDVHFTSGKAAEGVHSQISKYKVHADWF